MLERQLMMQRSRRLAVFAAATGLLTAGRDHRRPGGRRTRTWPASAPDQARALPAHVTESITAPTSVTVGVTASHQRGRHGDLDGHLHATAAARRQTSSGATTSETPATRSPSLPLPATPDSTCTVSADGDPPHHRQPATPSTSRCSSRRPRLPPPASASASSSPRLRLPGTWSRATSGKCVDDAGNSSANRAKIQIWSCNSFDKAQLWTYSNGELVHNGMCAERPGLRRQRQPR